MSIITDLYQSLFGKDHIQDGNVIDLSEHGRLVSIDDLIDDVSALE